MATQLIKPDKDRDLYVEWCSIGGEPIWIGNREDTKNYLLDNTPEPYRYTSRTAEARLTRADNHGSSSHHHGCRWDSAGIIYYQHWMPRANIAILADRLLAAPGWDVDFEDLVEETDS